ncbi:hypothetical protein V8F33_011398 [Rhypophila sp. PSN 637]
MKCRLTTHRGVCYMARSSTYAQNMLCETIILFPLPLLFMASFSKIRPHGVVGVVVVVVHWPFVSCFKGIVLINLP